MKPRYVEKQILGAITPLETDGRRLFRFIASQQLRDLDGDTVVAAGIDFTSYYLARGAGPLVLFHDQTRVVGKTLRLGVEVLNGVPSLVGVGEIDPPGTSVDGDRAWAQLRSGSLNATSIAFLVPPDGAERLPEGGRVLKRVLLIHLALVSQPALATAAVLETAAAKSCAVCTPSQASLAPSQAQLAAMHERLLKLTLPPPQSPEPVGLLAPLAGACGYKFVADPREDLARHHAWVAARERGITPPKPLFYKQVAGGESCDFIHPQLLSGIANLKSFPGVIGINVDVGVTDLPLVVAHEVAHQAGDGEREAAEFERAFVARHGTLPDQRPGVSFAVWQGTLQALRDRGYGVSEIERMFT